LAIGALTAPKAGDTTPLAQVQKSFGALRTVVFALRRRHAGGRRGGRLGDVRVDRAHDDRAAPATAPRPAGDLDRQALADGLRGQRPRLSAGSSPAALESLSGGRSASRSPIPTTRDLGLPHRRAADERPSERQVEAAAGRVAADLTAMSKLGPLFSAGRDEQQLFDLLAPLAAASTASSSPTAIQFRLTLRSPLKQ